MSKKKYGELIQRRSLKAGAAAEYMGISRRGLQDLAAAGKIPYSKLGPRLFVYDIAELDKFLDEHRVGA